MSKFDRILAKVAPETYNDKESLEKNILRLKAISKALNDGVSHYNDTYKYNDFLQPWYANAKDHYEEKLHKVDSVILTLEARLVNLSSTAGTDKV